MRIEEYMDGMIFNTPEQLKETKKWLKENAAALCSKGNSILNNDRKHDEHRDFANTQTIEGQAEDEYIDRRLLKAITSEKRILDKIFSERWEDLHELVSDEKLCKAIKSLTNYQKKILFWNVIQEYTTAEIAENFGVTDRSVRDVRQRALISIRKEIGAPLDVRYKKLKKIERTYRKKLKDVV